MDKITELLAQAAGQLGFEAARVWPQVVMVTFVNALFSLLLGLIVFAVGLAALVWIIRTAYRLGKTRGADDFAFFFCTMGGVLVLMVVVLAVIAVKDNLPGVLFPEATTVLRMIGK